MKKIMLALAAVFAASPAAAIVVPRVSVSVARPVIVSRPTPIVRSAPRVAPRPVYRPVPAFVPHRSSAPQDPRCIDPKFRIRNPLLCRR